MEGQGRARASEAGLGQAQRHEDDVEAELEEGSPESAVTTHHGQVEGVHA